MYRFKKIDEKQVGIVDASENILKTIELSYKLDTEFDTEKHVIYYCEAISGKYLVYSDISQQTSFPDICIIKLETKCDHPLQIQKFKSMYKGGICDVICSRITIFFCFMDIHGE